MLGYLPYVRLHDFSSEEELWKEQSWPAQDQTFEEEAHPEPQERSLFSAWVSRLFFFILLFTDVVWGVYQSAIWVVLSCLCATLASGVVYALPQGVATSTSNVPRLWRLPRRGSLSSSSGRCLPVLTLQHDREGVDAIVPTLLREHFENFSRS